MYENRRQRRRQERSRQNGIILILSSFSVVAIIVTVTIAVIRNRGVFSLPFGQPRPVPTISTELADQEDFDFQLYPNETFESAKYRAQTIGTGYVYVYNDGSVSTEPSDTVYVLNWPEIQQNYPNERIPRVMYLWGKGFGPNEGAEYMICAEKAELSDQTYTGYYCEAESVANSD